MRTIVSGLVLVLALASIEAAAQDAAQPAKHAPLALPQTLSALYRAQLEWEVTSTFFLRATDEDPADDTAQFVFSFRHPDRLKDTDGQLRVECLKDNKWQALAVFEVNALTLQCHYHPPVKFADTEVIEYEVKDPTGIVSAPATITVEVKPRGLRWEIITDASHSVTSDNFTGGVPEVIGKNGQDIMLGLDWLFRNPQYREVEDDQKLGKATYTGHFAFRIGVVTKPEAVEATPVAATGEPAPDAMPEPALAARQKFTSSGEFNYNLVTPTGADGGFLEIGALGRGNVDLAIEGATDFEQVAGQVLRLVRTGDGVGSFRGELGARVALKRTSDIFDLDIIRRKQRVALDPETGRRPSGNAAEQKVEYARNSDDMIVAEFGYQRNTAFKGATTPRISENRYFVRVFATPVDVGGTPGKMKPLIGFELTGGPDQATQAKILYGANLSALGNLFNR